MAVVASHGCRADSEPLEEMTITELTQIFGEEVPRPDQVEGDAWGIDATTEDILRLIDSPPDLLTADDFCGYLGYGTTGGDDDLRFLFPSILRIWEAEMYEKDCWFPSSFHEELCRTNFIERALSPRLRQATEAFMRGALAKRLAAESSLRIHGASTSHDWFGCVASFGVFTRAFPALWRQVWESDLPGHAMALLQYLSCLLYEDDSNPIFAPWSCDKGGGPPVLWDYDSIGFGESWKEENLDFFSSVLSSESIREWLCRASELHSGHPIATVATRFLRHLEECAPEVDRRIQLLLFALRTPSGVGRVTWDSLLKTYLT